MDVCFERDLQVPTVLHREVAMQAEQLHIALVTFSRYPRCSSWSA